jgi:hypothetical protein
MNRLKNHSSLFETAPILVKEWHPSANFDLTPRSVTIGYSKKVWWLCSEGHEWQATIKARLKNNDCLICVNAKKKADLSISLPSMGKNYRKNRRFKTKVTAVIELPDSGHWLYAEMTDFSSHGLCFETEAAIIPGTMIRVKFDKSLISSRFDQSFKSLFDNGYKTYNSTVMWCKKLDDDQSVSSYGLGVELI